MKNEKKKGKISSSKTLRFSTTDYCADKPIVISPDAILYEIIVICKNALSQRYYAINKNKYIKQSHYAIDPLKFNQQQ